MINIVLSKLFPPKLGKIENVDTVLRLQAIQNGTLKTYRAEKIVEAGIVQVLEWPEGRQYDPRRIR